MHRFRVRHFESTSPRRTLALVTLDRPNEMNMISLEMIRELDRALESADERRVAALILTESGRAFSAGENLERQRILGGHLRRASELTAPVASELIGMMISLSVTRVGAGKAI